MTGVQTCALPILTDAVAMSVMPGIVAQIARAGALANLPVMRQGHPRPRPDAHTALA